MDPINSSLPKPPLPTETSPLPMEIGRDESYDCKQPMSKPNFLSQLPEELITKTFPFLGKEDITNLSLTCRALRFCSNHIVLSQTFIRELFKKARGDLNQFPQKAKEQLEENVWLIEKLDLSFIPLNPEKLDTVIKTFFNLKKLKIGGMIYIPPPFCNRM